MNPVTGPVHVEGAEPGDALAVTIHDIELPEQGWSVYIPGAGALSGPMGEDWFVRRIPIRDGRVHLTDGLTCPVAPMIGCIGVAPADGEMSTVMPSYPTGGNMDLTDAAPGSTVYLPVQVAGALLSIGDIHAVMSRGESSFVAIEAAGSATVSVDLVKGLALRAPAHRHRRGHRLRRPRRPGAGLDRHGLRVALRGPRRRARVLAGRTPTSTMSALAHTELGGPTGSTAPDPVHPFRAVGAVTLARIAKAALGG